MNPRSEMFADFLHLIRDGIRFIVHHAKTPPVAVPVGIVGVVWVWLLFTDLTWILLIGPILIGLAGLGFFERSRADTEQERLAKAEKLRREQEAEEERKRLEQLAALEAQRAKKKRLKALRKPRQRLFDCIAWRRDDLRLIEWLREEEEAYAKNAVDRERQQKRRSLLRSLDHDLELA